MKIILVPIAKFIFWWIVFGIGIIYSVLYFIYDPKAMIDEKRNHLETTGNYEKQKDGSIKWETDWWKTFLSYDFHCPFLNS